MLLNLNMSDALKGRRTLILMEEYRRELDGKLLRWIIPRAVILMNAFFNYISPLRDVFMNAQRITSKNWIAS